MFIMVACIGRSFMERVCGSLDWGSWTETDDEVGTNRVNVENWFISWHSFSGFSKATEW